ncbi:MAG: hypothetical protein ABEJ74_04600 [Haloferacaceae archaeon]
MVSTRAIALLTFALGLVVGIAVGVAMVPTGPAPVDPDDPQYSIATGTGCIGDPGGWYFTSNVERGRLLVVNVTVPHAPDEDVTARFDHTGEGRYQFVLTTTEGGKAGSPDCPTGTTAELGATIPREFQSVTVVYDGDVLTTIGSSGQRDPVMGQFAVDG